MATPALVLIVDDDEDIRAVLADGLGRRGFETVTAESGEVALDKARARKFDIVITDLQMTGMDGMATLAGLKAIDPALRVMVATGYATEEARYACTELGAAVVIQKPFDIDEICLAVDRTLEAT